MIYDKILSQILCFRPFNRKRQAGVFKNPHSEDRFRKPAFLVPNAVNTVYV